MFNLIEEFSFDSYDEPPRGKVHVLVSSEFKKRPDRMTLLETFIKDRLYKRLVYYLDWSIYSDCSIKIYYDHCLGSFQLTKNESTDVQLLLENYHIWSLAFTSASNKSPISLNVVYYR